MGMFTIKTNEMKKPIKVWLEDINQLEPQCLEQATNLSNLPFAFKHISLMPDTHSGYGMPIGGVLATEDVIIPNAVGVDIGCGMAFSRTNINVNELNSNILNTIVSQIKREIPVGFNSHKEEQECEFSKIFEYTVGKHSEIDSNSMKFQIGTLGGGNHFIELQRDDNDMLCIMVHSGSRHFGYSVANHYNKVAKELNKKWFSSVPENHELAYLPLNSYEGELYYASMLVALEFAKANRNRMMIKIQGIISDESYPILDVHHNYATREHHYGRNVWVHRKGAIRTDDQTLGIIPGAMGSYSYIVKGLNTDEIVESFYSCSHGAGRAMSRTKAKELFSVEDVTREVINEDFILGANANNVIDETRMAYKDIQKVMKQQEQLITIISTLKTLAVVKG